MRNAGLKEAQAGIKIAGRNINNLRYADQLPRVIITNLPRIIVERNNVEINTNVIVYLKNISYIFFLYLIICLHISHTYVYSIYMD